MPSLAGLWMFLVALIYLKCRSWRNLSKAIYLVNKRFFHKL